MINIVKQIVYPLRPSSWQERREARRREKAMIDFYRLFVKHGDLCFDIGANVGNRTEVFLKLGASVVAVEPQQACLQELRRKFSRHRKVSLVEKALGDVPGERELLVSNSTTISSMSREWIKSVQESGRFSEFRWDESVMVAVTTLDELIDEYGLPDFVKIDVEGFECQVVKGLSRPLRALSFEFVVEILQNAMQCIRHLSDIGKIECNYSTGESMELVLQEWVTGKNLYERLCVLPEKDAWGDVYVRFIH